ncbi:Uncharacterised protein [Streptococcus pneumoniae]|nr:Uncharacterised protein [Streptococcus pneumoniae]
MIPSIPFTPRFAITWMFLSDVKKNESVSRIGILLLANNVASSGNTRTISVITFPSNAVSYVSISRSVSFVFSFICCHIRDQSFFFITGIFSINALQNSMSLACTTSVATRAGSLHCPDSSTTI